MSITAEICRGDRIFEVKQTESGAPCAGQVQIQVPCCGICGTDLRAGLGHMDGRVGFHPVFGHEMSGVVKSIGKAAEGWAPGDRIIVRPLDHCGTCPARNRGLWHICRTFEFIGLDSQDAMLQLWKLPAHTFRRLPENVSCATPR